jgi:hypothetical protein
MLRLEPTAVRAGGVTRILERSLELAGWCAQGTLAGKVAKTLTLLLSRCWESVSFS